MQPDTTRALWTRLEQRGWPLIRLRGRTVGGAEGEWVHVFPALEFADLRALSRQLGVQMFETLIEERRGILAQARDLGFPVVPWRGAVLSSESLWERAITHASEDDLATLRRELDALDDQRTLQRERDEREEQRQRERAAAQRPLTHGEPEYEAAQQLAREAREAAEYRQSTAGRLEAIEAVLQELVTELRATRTK